MADARIELLQRMPIFGGVRAETLQFLAGLAGTTRVTAGEYFFRQDEPADAMFVLEEGRVAIIKESQRRRVDLGHLATGDCFGEMALIDLLPRSASVLALEDCRAIRLSPGDLFCLYEKDLEQFTIIEMNLGREVCRRLRRADEALMRARFDVEDGGNPNRPRR